MTPSGILDTMISLLGGVFFTILIPAAGADWRRWSDAQPLADPDNLRRKPPASSWNRHTAPVQFLGGLPATASKSEAV